MKNDIVHISDRPPAIKRYQSWIEEMDSNKKKKLKTSLLAWGLILPGFIFLTLFTLYPIAKSLYLSFFRIDLSVSTPEFIGLKNYTDLLKDDVFKQAFMNNILIALFTIPTSIALAVAMAIFANKVRVGKSLIRVAYFYPTILPMVAVANIWLFIYTPIYGIIGYLDPSLRILGNPDTALWAIIIMLIWKQAGYVMVFYLSGLQGISRELYEAAELDGAKPITIFHKITWPLLKPTTIYVAIISLTNAYKVVDHLYIMTKGGPGNATNMLLFYIYQVGFDFWDTGKADTMTVVLIAMLLLITAIWFFSQDKRTFYG
ncbi:MAG TPA: sugar ABC transporter permease [Rectinema sp.]|jgi:sn-glycerol 3-phosphate transport system permease protein|nr:sugar ABC transporter permease [Rectinema sp.]HOD58911.1 sugar ABC transporter permease [Rectinema sp.]HOE99201.1 sugar ABC transporter permease [Rectinema sp.]HPN03710.1 sugar ABC transporter permease [Rectinema sp.]HPW02181.1 sugar ABC transporter permease [Rectinema sp.]